MAREKGAKPANGDAPEADFEGAMNELERIVEELEGNQLTLDQSLSHYERGMVLASQLTKTLDSAEKRIEKLVEGAPGDEPRTEPMGEESGGRHAEPSRGSEPSRGRDLSEGELPF